MMLSVQNICLSYGSDPVLRDVSFTLEPTERVLLLGPSGSGKSSLLNIICGLQTPDSGEVMLGDETMREKGDFLRKRHMGIIFQTLRLVSALNVRDNLLLAQRLQTGKSDVSLVNETIEQLGIAHRAKARPFELSQGEAQRAAIARAIVVRPSVLIADEPTSALDQANTDIVAKLLIEAAETTGASLLVATHDDRIKAHFTRTLELEMGAIVQ